MAHVSVFNFEDVQEMMKHAPKVRSWNGLLKYMLNNESYKGRHEGNALPGLIQAVSKLRDGGEAFTKDPRELWERINSRPSDIRDAGGYGLLSGREPEDGYISTYWARGAFPRKEPNHFEDAVRAGGWPAVSHEAAGRQPELPEPYEYIVPAEGFSAVIVGIKNLARRAAGWRLPVKGLLAAAGITGLALAGVLTRKAVRRL